jgi:hypothetical protein
MSAHTIHVIRFDTIWGNTMVNRFMRLSLGLLKGGGAIFFLSTSCPRLPIFTAIRTVLYN